jgi:tetratricopeptide repeat protein
MDQMQGPVYVSGRILMESGKPTPEPVSVELNCGMRPLQMIHTDLGGYFTFTLGAGVQSNADFSASNENPMAQSGSRPGIPGGAGGSLTGCEVRVALPGYHPLTYTLSQHADMGRLEVGTLHLQRIAGVEGSAISVTSLLVPNNSRKEFEKAEKEVRSNHPDAARQHLEKAIAGYEKYAAAWNELGRIYSSSNSADKAREAFQNAIAADPQYTPPYLSLAMLELESRHYESAVETASKLLDLDSGIGMASFVEAVGYFNLNRLDDAQKSAQQAEKGPHQNIPQLHALLADIFLQKQDYPRAAAQMQTYLKESPNGQFAEQMKKNLEQIQQATGNDGNQPGSLAKQPKQAEPE